MEGEQKRVFLVITQEEIDGIQPPKGDIFYEVFIRGGEIWVSEKLMKQKNSIPNDRKKVCIFRCIPAGWRTAYQPSVQKRNGQRRMHMSYKVVRLAHAGKRNRYLAATGIAFIGYVLFLSSALWFPGQ